MLELGPKLAASIPRDERGIDPKIDFSFGIVCVAPSAEHVYAMRMA